jgi:hypothetical protein
MRKQLAMGGCILAATALIVWAGSVRAQPPESMTYAPIFTPIIACDTHDQVGEIVQAIKDGNLQEKLTELAAIGDDKREPARIYSPLATVVFGNSEHIGRIEDHDRTIDAWISHVGNPNRDFYVLWGEEVPSTPA